MNMPILRPCPFCGAEQGGSMGLEAIWIEGYRKGRRSEWWIVCQECGAQGGARTLNREAIEAWNERDGQSLNDQIGCLYEIRCLIGDKTGKLMQSEVVERVRELVVKRDVQEYIERKRREAAKGEK